MRSGLPRLLLGNCALCSSEGEPDLGERERFARLTHATADVRFMEAGSSSEVLRRCATVQQLAREGNSPIRVGGIVDRDFKSERAVNTLSDQGLFVLPVHEVENLYLHPPTLDALLRQNGLEADSLSLIQEASDSRAGSWIFQHAMATQNARLLPELTGYAKRLAKNTPWSVIDVDTDGVVERVAGGAGFDEEERGKLVDILKISVAAYARIRSEEELWRECEGKEVLASLAPRIGYAGPRPLIQATLVTWERELRAPDELVSVQRYVADL